MKKTAQKSAPSVTSLSQTISPRTFARGLHFLAVFVRLKSVPVDKSDKPPCKGRQTHSQKIRIRLRVEPLVGPHHDDDKAEGNEITHYQKPGHTERPNLGVCDIAIGAH